LKGRQLLPLTAPKDLFKYQSARVIALGRVMLGILFLIAVSLERTAPSETQGTYALLLLYVGLALTVTALTWRNWWVDARLAVPMHALDMAVFTVIVFSTDGSTTPFFLFFVLPLLSAAIRWGWRETALTATTLIVLFICAGWLVAGTGDFELERFVRRSGHLLILSLLLIWFGIHQGVGGHFLGFEDVEGDLEKPESPLTRALHLAMKVTKARRGALLIGPTGEEASEGVCSVAGEDSTVNLGRPAFRATAPSVFLFNISADRSLTRPPKGRFQFASGAAVMDLDAALPLGLTEGLAIEVRTGTCQGWLILSDIADLSVDFIDLGRELGRAAGSIIDRQALLEAIENGAAARTRLSLARDVHDSIVQFLAGAAFRVEAIKRTATSGAVINAELEELKRLLVDEQAEIRGFLLALRSERELGLADAVAELRALAERLSQQWSVDCHVSTDGDQGLIPIRLQLDLQQMLREAVANAVRHGHADRVDVNLAVENNRLHVRVEDNGAGFPVGEGAAVEPWSLKERVERAHGSLRLVSQPGSTNILIDLPLTGAAA
jgi:signal transduction histidine kinase